MIAHTNRSLQHVAHKQKQPESLPHQIREDRTPFISKHRSGKDLDAVIELIASLLHGLQAAQV